VRKLLTGRAAFVDDLARPHGLLHAALVASPHPHARIAGIDAAAARSLPGVLDVITHEADSGAASEPALPRSATLLPGTVRFVGAPAAIVVAEDPEIAWHAAEAVRVAYEPLPAIVWSWGDTGSAAATARVEISHGDVARAFREADRFVEVAHRFERSRVLPAEPPAALAWLDEDSLLVVRSASSSPLRLRLALADALGVTGGSIRVERPEVGGDFGSRGGALLEIVCGLVTLRTGRACRLVLRGDHPAGSLDRGATSVEARAALRGGAITGIEIRLRQDVGQVTGHPDIEGELRRAGAATSIYDIPATGFEAEAVATHGPPAGGGAGLAAVLALEGLVDQAAQALGVEPLALRRRLLADAGPKGGLRGSLERCWREAASSRRAKPSAAGARRGLGLALARAPLAGADAVATLARNEDGSFTASWSPCELSTSASGALQALAARSLAVPPPPVTVNLGLQAEPPPAGVADLWIAARAVESAGAQMAAKAKAKARTAKGDAALVVHATHRTDQAPAPEGAFVAEVEVDPETGVVRVLRLVQALGAGANEPLIAAKVEGDALRGVSSVLFEWTPDSIAARTRLRSVDLPSLTTLLARDGRPRPLGALPVGEVALQGAAAAVANAVAHACGVRIGGLPMNPERVLAALESARALTLEGSGQ
jgi:putative selenate reductase molybdopterin-binding subunit